MTTILYAVLSKRSKKIQENVLIFISVAFHLSQIIRFLLNRNKKISIITVKYTKTTIDLNIKHVVSGIYTYVSLKYILEYIMDALMK